MNIQIKAQKPFLFVFEPKKNISELLNIGRSNSDILLTRKFKKLK